MVHSGWLFLAEDDRRESPAEYHEDKQGGSSQSKPPDLSGAASASIYPPEVLFKACWKCELIHGWNHGDATEEIVERSSLTFAGWADAIVHCYKCK